jgi:hypothetical protein
MLALSERQYGVSRDTKLNQPLKLALAAWLHLLKVAPQRSLEPASGTQVEEVIFTDGFWDERHDPPGQVGIVVFEAKGGRKPLYCSAR